MSLLLLPALVGAAASAAQREDQPANKPHIVFMLADGGFPIMRAITEAHRGTQRHTATHSHTQAHTGVRPHGRQTPLPLPAALPLLATPHATPLFTGCVRPAPPRRFRLARYRISQQH